MKFVTHDNLLGLVGLAQKAADEGRHVCLIRVNVNTMDDLGMSGEMRTGGKIIEAVEDFGWRLDHMSFSGGGIGYFLFRR